MFWNNWIDSYKKSKAMRAARKLELEEENARIYKLGFESIQSLRVAYELSLALVEKQAELINDLKRSISVHQELDKIRVAENKSLAW
jgi:hypothetical protein